MTSKWIKSTSLYYLKHLKVCKSLINFKKFKINQFKQTLEMTLKCHVSAIELYLSQALFLNLKLPLY